MCAGVGVDHRRSTLVWPSKAVSRCTVSVTSIQELSDQDLLRQIIRRDESALALLYDRHSRLVYSVALRILRSPGDAEEVLQETFVRVWARANTYEPTLGSGAAWLTRIARNGAIDRLRSRKVRHDLDAAVPVDDQAGGGPRPELATMVTPEALLEENVKAGLVRGALRSLPQAQRTLIEAAFFEGYTHTELSERFDVPLGTVKARIRTGLLALRSQLAHAVS